MVLLEVFDGNDRSTKRVPFLLLHHFYSVIKLHCVSVVCQLPVLFLSGVHGFCNNVDCIQRVSALAKHQEILTPWVV